MVRLPIRAVSCNLHSRSHQPSCAQLLPAAPLPLDVLADALPETKVVQIGGFRVGLCHGHQVTPAGEVEALASLHRSLDVDVLITGESA